MDSLTPPPDPSREPKSLDCFTGDGEMAALMRAYHWSSTPLGPVAQWPQSLKTAVRIILGSRYPMFVWWGSRMINLYNDGYIPMLGNRHPDALGESAFHIWTDVWDTVGPQAEAVLNQGRSSWNQELLLVMERNGYTEETYFTFSYSPVADDGGGVGGIFCAVTEDTARVLGQRRLRTLRTLATSAVQAKTTEEACDLTASALAENPYDLPFALLYLLDDSGRQARLAGTAGLTAGARGAPLSLELNTAADQSGWPLNRVMTAGQGELVADLLRRFGPLPGGPWPEPAQSAMVLPLAQAGQERSAGFLIAGISPRRVLSDDYRGFLGLAAGQVATALANVRAYEAERRRAEALAELDRAKTAFFNNVSHEFRTPLTLMLGPLEDSLADAQEPLAPRQRERLETAHRNSLRLLKLVNTLLDFARIEAGRIQAVYQPTDLSALTAELASTFRSACERAGLRLLVDCPPLPEVVDVDRDMWEKIVLNLLSNAFKFTLAGEIKVKLRSAGDSVELAVRDTGTGIASDEIPRLFERFHRPRNAGGRTHEGTGIGLALVQELVKLHGGSVRVESVQRQGSTFTVAIPRQRLQPAAERSDALRTPAASTTLGASPYIEEALRWLPDTPDSTRVEQSLSRDLVPLASFRHDQLQRETAPRARILLADDNADLRDYLRRLLSGRYTVDTAPDGQAALAAVRTWLPDLVLADVMMPGLDGLELLRELRSQTQTRLLPVILLSARAGEEVRVEGLEAGADDYLIKPFSARELLARVAVHLELARMRREVSRALEESEQRLRTVYDHAPVGISECDLDGRILRVNQRFCEITGYSREELLVRRFQDITHPDDIDANVDLYHRLQAGEIPHYRMEKRYIHKQGHPVWLELHGALVRESDGKPRFGIGVVQDITARKRAEEALKEAERRKDEFLAILAHELRNPLAPIRNALEILRLTDGQNPASQQVREIMERQVDHIIRLVDDLLEISRITRGKIALRKETVALTAVIDTALEITRPLIEAGGHTLALTLPPETLTLQADPVRLAQVIANLLNNAAKYTEKGGHLWLTAERQDDWALVRVRDNGIGIPDQMLPRVFDLFAQVDSSPGHTRGGLGIGLALVKSLVQMHGGSVEAHSAGLNQGSEFTVRLPLPPLPCAAREEAGQRPSTQPSMRLEQSILVVDDNRDAAESLGILLRHLGADVQIVNSGPAALTALSRYRPTVVLLDLGMPGMDGYQVARRIREQPEFQNVSLIALTGWGQDEDRRRTREAGFDHHLVKPVDLQGLKALLTSRLASAQQGPPIDEPPPVRRTPPLDEPPPVREPPVM